MVKLLPYQELFDRPKDGRLALWNSDRGLLVAMSALGAKDPYAMAPDEFNSIASELMANKKKVGQLWSDSKQLFELWNAKKVDVAVAPNWLLPSLGFEGGEAHPTPAAQTIVSLCGIGVLAKEGADDPDTYSILDALIDEQSGATLLSDLQLAPVNRAIFESNDDKLTAIRNGLGLAKPEVVLKAPIWDRGISPELAKQLDSLRAGLMQ